MASNMDVEEEEFEVPTSSSARGEKKRFEVKKVNDESCNFLILYIQNLCFVNLTSDKLFFTIK